MNKNIFNDFSLTQNEEQILLEWIESGENHNENPWNINQKNGLSYPFIEAVRIISGLYHENISQFINQNLSSLNIDKSEENDLIEWLQSGNSYYDNPWHIAQENGSPYSFIEALRITKNMTINKDNYIVKNRVENLDF